jgi:hypothetical protein
MKYPATLFGISLLAILVNAATAPTSGAAPASLERGSRVVASVQANKASRLSVVEHQKDDGNLSVVIEGADGRKLRNDVLVAALDRDEEDVSSYNVSARKLANGQLEIRSVKDWGTSNWSYGYTVSFRDGAYQLDHFDYKLDSPKKHGNCSLDLAKASAVVNGRTRSFTVPEQAFEQADGIELERICQQLGMN